MRALLVHNPTAGIKDHEKDGIIDALRLTDFKVDYVSTKDDDVKDALKGARDIVIVAGGDGTVGYVFTHLADRSVPIGVLPLGSANNIARSLGIAGTPQELAEQWRLDDIRPFHLRAWLQEGLFVRRGVRNWHHAGPHKTACQSKER
jgi:diacylglycerol kinase (ATP)